MILTVKGLMRIVVYTLNKA